MPDESFVDLSKLDAWSGVRPGMLRAQVLEALQQQGVEAEEYGSDNLMATTEDWEMEFYFTTDGSERLRQLSIEEGDVRWAGQPLIGARLDAALRALEPGGPAMWEANDATSEPFPPPDEEPAEQWTDEALLEEATVWLPQRGLGLVIYEGEVSGVAWRAAQDLPARFVGPVTDAQRQLSLRPDLETYLREKRTAQIQASMPKDPLKPLRAVLTFAAIVALTLVGKKGFEEMRLWAQATTLQGKLVAIENAPMKQFRDFLPPALRWVVPPTKPVIVEVYRVEYNEPDGERHEVVLERGELYVPPQQPGDEVPVAWVDGDPPRVKGLSRARDSAFVDYMPWAIAIGALWLLGHFLLSLLPALLRQLPKIIKRLVPSNVVKDSDRPELR